jgi:hypothetical protein
VGFWIHVEGNVVNLIRKLLSVLGDNSKSRDSSFPSEDDILDFIFGKFFDELHLSQLLKNAFCLNELRHSIDIEKEPSPINLRVDRVAWPDIQFVSFDPLRPRGVEEARQSANLFEFTRYQSSLADRPYKLGKNRLVL